MKTYLTQSGVYFSTQAEAKDAGEPYEIVEVPTDKPGLLAYLNALEKVDGQLSEEIATPVVPPKLNETDAAYAKVRQDVLQGNLDLEETLWNAPLDLCLRLATIIMDRTREHFAKEQKNVRPTE